MGVFWSQYFPPKARFSVDDIPDLTGKVFLVTGGNSGIGYESIKQLLMHNAKVYMGARSKSKAIEAIAELEKTTGKRAEFLEVDLSDLASVRAAAADFQRREEHLHVLMNNGGVMQTPMEQLCAQGYDLQFTTNVLGPFYLTQLLLPTLISTARTTGNPARILNLTSVASFHWGLPNIKYETILPGAARTKLGNLKMYWQTKYANALMSNELHRRYASEGIMACAVNPGNLQTPLMRHMPAAGRIISVSFILANILIMYPQPKGALTQLWAGTTPEGESLGGKFLFPWARVGVNPPEDPSAGKDLWKWCEEQIAKFEGQGI
ncbi:NAD-binding protein [Mycena kentingensis (nom. inval.)]|nr:NAD-binding protein [Mycena kentingensis (nom. inval.)]